MARPPARWAGKRGSWSITVPGAALLGVATCIGIVARLWPRGALWLDEAQTVAFAREPLHAIPALLRTDGAPPLYYLLLHRWMQWFGSGDDAVRALSVGFSVLTVPVLVVAVRRLFGGRVALIALVVLLTNPFAIRYATEARMYALVVLLVSLALAVLPSVLRPRPSRAHDAPVTFVGPAFLVLVVVVAALLWTHYWSLYLLAACSGLVGVQLVIARRAAEPGGLQRRSGWRRVGVALALGAVAWLPWYPSWRLQWERTGTPWSRPVAWWRLVEVFFAHAGGWSVASIVLGSVFIGVSLLAVAPSAPSCWTRVHAAVRPAAPAARPLAGVLVGTAVLAVAGARLSGSAAEGRYTAVLLPLTVTVVAAGVGRLRDDRLVVAVLVVMAALATPSVLRQLTNDRTPARTVAAVLAARAEPGDLLVICPEQLGPAVARELALTSAADLPTSLYPAWSAPARIDWVGYADRYRDDWPAGFAAEADRRGGDAAVWLLWSETYATSAASCRALAESLRARRPGEQRVLVERPRPLGPGEPADRAALSRFAASPPAGAT